MTNREDKNTFKKLIQLQTENLLLKKVTQFEGQIATISTTGAVACHLIDTATQSDNVTRTAIMTALGVVTIFNIGTIIYNSGRSINNDKKILKLLDSNEVNITSLKGNSK